MKHLPLFMLLLVTSVAAQDRNQPTNSLFDDYEIKMVVPKNISIQGEVQNPGLVDLNLLPLRSVAVKELGLENGKQAFKGAYFASGYALCDILNSEVIKKAPENTFGPSVDMYIIVENDKGEKSVFSWGEIYYRNSFDILITRSAQAIYPARAKPTWSLSPESRLICGSDLLNVRFINSPTRITVRSYRGAMPVEKPKDSFSPEIKIVTKTGSTNVGDIGSSVEKRNSASVLYGHGMGFREVLNFSGYLLKDLIAGKAQWAPENSRDTIAVVSAKDGYRTVFSASEIMNRSDHQDVLLNDLKDTPVGGRYTLIAPGDFFADRNVKSVEKIELLSINP